MPDSMRYPLSKPSGYALPSVLDSWIFAIPRKLSKVFSLITPWILYGGDMTQHANLLTWILERADRCDGCFTWRLAKSHGQAVTWYAGRVQPVGRLVWSACYGLPLLTGERLHRTPRCASKACVNPEHYSLAPNSLKARCYDPDALAAHYKAVRHGATLWALECERYDHARSALTVQAMLGTAALMGGAVS